MSSSPQPDPWIGRLLGDRRRYRLDKCLGRGGMGDIFLAMDTLLGQQVALKLLKDTIAESGELKKRFEREVALCTALKSDHIAQISDYGVTPEGHPFYVMEYLRGQSLEQLLRRDKCLSVERTVDIITQVCEGLCLAHKGVTLWRNGATLSEHIKVVHRDLKPANIFLVPTALGELVKILDFGIAKKIYDDQVEHTKLTNIFLGTFHYAAPEQLRIKKDLDGRADIYSLGIILYEMLTGTDPFGLGLNVRNISGMSWAMAHTSKQPQPPRSQPGCEQLSPELEMVVIQCLQKAPEQRFASADELSQALKAAVGGFRFSDTASQSQIPSRQSTDDLTILRPLTPELGVDATVPQTPSPRQGSDDLTILRPLTPSGHSGQGSDITIVQLPPPGQGSPNSTVNPYLTSEPGVDATITQVPSAPQQRVDATIAQIPPPANQGISDTTIAQVSSAPNQGVPDRTIVQVPSPPSQGVPDTTIIQPPPSLRQDPSQGIDTTIAQVPSLPRNQLPDATIVQASSVFEPRVDDSVVSIPLTSPGQGVLYSTVAETPRRFEQKSRSRPTHNLLPLWIGLVVSFAIMGAAYTYIQFQSRSQLHNIRTLKTESKHAECITKAETVAQDSGLYKDAQKLLNDCRIEHAKKLAAGKDFDAAILVARKIPQGSPLRSEAQALINQWSKQDKST